MRRTLAFVSLGFASLAACSNGYSSDDPTAPSLDAGPDAGLADTGAPIDAGAADVDAPTSLAISPTATTLTFDDTKTELSVGIDVHVTGKLDGPVNVVLSGLPTGIVSDPGGASIDDPVSRPTAVFRLYRASPATTGTFVVTATATSGALTATTTFTVAVTYGPLLPGQLDTAFGSGGIAAVPSVHAFLILPDGGLYTAHQDTSTTITLKRYAADLSVTTTATLNLDFFPSKLKQDGAGNILIAGPRGNDFAIARVKPSGMLDASFNGGTGLLDIPARTSDRWGLIALDVSVDRIVVLLGDIALAFDGPSHAPQLFQMLSTGALDPDFASPAIPEDTFDDVEIASSALLVVAGFHSEAGKTTRAAAYQISRKGVITTTGLTPSGLANATANAIAAVNADGSAVVTGYAESTGSVNAAIARFQADGTLDPAFGAGGSTVSLIPGFSADPKAAAKTTDGGYLGLSVRATTDDELVLFRYGADGQLDPKFGTSGFASAPVPANPEIGNLPVDARIIDTGQSIVVGVSISGPAAPLSVYHFVH